MRVTRLDVEQNPKLANVKGWLSAIQKKAKSAEQPAFKVDGPRSIPTRMRHNAAARRPIIGGGSMVAQSSTRPRAFMGDEEFALTDVFQHVEANRASTLIQVTFVPKNPAALPDVQSVTMPLDAAADVFVGFESWLATIEPEERPKVLTAAERAELEALRLEQEREENEEYGSW